MAELSHRSFSEGGVMMTFDENEFEKAREDLLKWARIFVANEALEAMGANDAHRQLCDVGNDLCAATCNFAVCERQMLRALGDPDA